MAGWCKLTGGAGVENPPSWAWPTMARTQKYHTCPASARKLVTGAATPLLCKYSSPATKGPVYSTSLSEASEAKFGVRRSICLGRMGEEARYLSCAEHHRL